MITAVVDTNVLASGFVRPEPSPGQLLAAWQAGRFILVVSEHIMAELARTLDEPYFSERLTSRQRLNNLRLIRNEAVLIAINVDIRGVATHPEDDLVLAAAVSAHADYLVTGDTGLQRLRSYQGVTIVNPREFLERL